MNLQLSAQAWAALGCLAGVVLLSGAILWTAWRQGTRFRRRTPPSENIEGPSFTRSWKKEDDQFAELARQADVLRAHPQENSADNKPQG